ncbi:MAG TPA: hypothetical protein VHO23_01150 [Candidatus Paceibacterota bacterium]|nr:hypothetical protein [Candidatus Paceibacterota bacterium]
MNDDGVSAPPGAGKDGAGVTCTRTNPDGGTTGVVTSGSQTGTTDKDAAGNVTSQKTVNSSACQGDFLCALSNSISWLLTPLALGILGLSTFLLWISGLLFNWAIIRTVFEFGQYFGNSSGLLLAWSIMRDIGNIVLLFGFIFMGIATILNTHSMDEYSARKALPRLIIFAILLNFSLFAAQAIIDISNAFGSTFALQAGQDCSGDRQDGGCANQGISGSIISMAGIATVWDPSVVQAQSGSDDTKKFIIYIGTALFVTIAAVTLAAGAIMLVIRAVVLMFLMMTSPIGFAGMAVPQFQGLARKWWGALISQAFFAPVYVLLVLISIKVAEGLGNGQPIVGALASGSSDSMQVVLVYMIVIGLMIMSLVASKRLGAMGANFATKTAGGAVFGAYGFVGRRTIGIASAKAGTAIRRSPLGKTEVGRFAAGIADKGSHASFDARSSKSFNAFVAKPGGLDFGKPNKAAAHGIHGIEEAEVKKRTEYAKTLTQTEKQKEAQGALKKEKERTTKSWKSREKNLDAKVTELEQSVRDYETGDRRKKIEADILAERERGAEAFKRGDTEAFKTSSAAVDSLTASLDALAVEAEAETKRLEEARATRERESQAYETEIKRIDDEIGRTQPATIYAENIGHPTNPVVKAINKASLGGHVTHEAREKIKKNGSKSDIDKALDTIKENTNKKDDDHGGGEDHGSGGGQGGGTHAAPKSGGGGTSH